MADAAAIFRFLQRRGVVSVPPHSPPLPPLPALRRPASPLSGVDMIMPDAAGLVAWRVKPGDEVAAGEILGEIVDPDDPDRPRVPIVSNTAGVVFGMRRHKLVRPGQIIIKVAGCESLSWRKAGNLLTM